MYFLVKALFVMEGDFVMFTHNLQVNVSKLVDEWQQQNSSDHFHLRLKEDLTDNSAVGMLLNAGALS